MIEIPGDPVLDTTNHRSEALDAMTTSMSSDIADGGLGARNVGRPGQTAEDVRERYAAVVAEIRQALPSLRRSLDCWPTSTAALPEELARAETILKGVRQLKSVIEAGP